ncbi:MULTISPECIES: hypothetical protein [unclassified Aeromonas]|uniref:hypothetical protein n=1 Tax=unclassified Aeromonas TaxID=257493 RepID=UPI003528EE23
MLLPLSSWLTPCQVAAKPRCVAGSGRVGWAKAILVKAFRGELTADWRAANPDLISGDNSAALLARIQAERAAASGKKGKRGTSKTRTTD